MGQKYPLLALLLGALAGLPACDPPSGAPAAGEPGVSSARPPNVILLLADDIGVETVGAYGSEYATPRIDSIANNGTRFDFAHATPLCTPSRVRVLTGRYSFENYVDFGILDPAETTLAHRLRDAGYRTLAAGKWQLAGVDYDGVPPGTLPADAGFDEHVVWYLERRSRGSRYWQPRLVHDGVPREHAETEFGPTLVNERVLDFIEANRERPFFIYYSMLLAHSPWVTTPVSPGAETDKEKFAGMMAYMDVMVGNVLDTLERFGLAENTLVVFVGDNGTHHDITSRRNGVAVQGGKRTTRLSGTHVPLLVQWPGAAARRAASDSLVDIMDVSATILDAAGVPRPDTFDGVSLLPELRGEAASPREWVFMHYDAYRDPEASDTEPARFAFDRAFKLYGDGRFYDLGADPDERDPLPVDELASAQNPQAAAAHARLASVLSEIDDGPFFRDLPAAGGADH